MLRTWSYRGKIRNPDSAARLSSSQCGADIARCEHVVERLLQAREHLLQLRVGVRQRGCEAEDVVAEAAEHQAVAVGRRKDPVGQSQRRIEATLAALVADELQRAQHAAVPRVADQ